MTRSADPYALSSSLMLVSSVVVGQWPKGTIAASTQQRARRVSEGARRATEAAELRATKKAGMAPERAEKVFEKTGSASKAGDGFGSSREGLTGCLERLIGSYAWKDGGRMLKEKDDPAPMVVGFKANLQNFIL